jgi:hypothetical protein
VLPPFLGWDIDRATRGGRGSKREVDLMKATLKKRLLKVAIMFAPLAVLAATAAPGRWGT